MVKLMKYYIGIDIGGTNTKLGLISQNGQVVKSCVFPTQSKDGFDILPALPDFSKKNNFPGNGDIPLSHH